MSEIHGKVFLPLESFLTWWQHPAYTKSPWPKGKKMLWPDTRGRFWTAGNVLFLSGLALIGAVLMYLLWLSAPDL